MSLTPDRHDFEVVKGATFRKRLILHQTDLTSNPRDLTDHTASLVIHDKPDGSVLKTLDTSNGGIVLGGNTGTLDLIIPAAETATLSWTSGTYLLTITAGSGGDTDPLLWGAFRVKAY